MWYAQHCSSPSATGRPDETNVVVYMHMHIVDSHTFLTENHVGLLHCM